MPANALRPGAVISMGIATLAVAFMITGCSATEPEALEPTATTAASDQQLIQDQLDQMWSQVESQYPELARPSVEIVRLVSLEDWAPTMAECLSAAGFADVSAGEDGSLEWGSVPQAQASAFELARYTCSAQFPQDPKFLRPLTGEQLGRLYDYYTGDLTACLTELGYEVPAPPSRQEFQDTYATSPWLPFSEAAEQATAAGASAELAAACPQLPATLWE